jgi:enoyl-CoA hydratase
MTHDVSVRDGVATVTLARPEARNALRGSDLGDLTRRLDALAIDPQVRAVVVTGADPAFCAGLDLGELRADPSALLAVASDPLTNPWRALRSLPQPVIGAVNGPAITGGLELALGCDFLVASRRARFGDTHAAVGVLPAQGAGALLTSAVGAPMAKYLMYTGTVIDADEALRIGLVSRVVEHENLLDTAHRLAVELAGGRAAALRALKRSFEEGLQGDRREWLAVEARLAGSWNPVVGARD